MTLRTATPIVRFTPGADGVDKIYEESGTIIVRMKAPPHLLFCSGGHALFDDTVVGTKRKPQGRKGKTNPYGAPLGGLTK